jgi:hypothetical protein
MTNTWPRVERKFVRATDGPIVNGVRCLLWPLVPSTGGYGTVKFEGRQWRVHILRWIRLVGPIPEGMLVLHHCDVRLCAEIRHLYIGTYSNNRRDTINRKRHVPKRSRITEQKRQRMRIIYERTSLTMEQVGELFGMSKSQTQALIKGS